MSPSPETRDFLFFKAEGDAEALARVFDRIAPRLLLLAGHFARDAAEAEDLVQMTFLQALRTADSFDGTREVQPWLAGILRHRAIDQLRRSKRRGEVAEPDESLVENRSTPVEKLAQQENYERLTKAIEDLDERYRDVLVLRLVHELEPASIARALGRSPSGVRTQCQRGLEKLRGALRGDRALLALLPHFGEGLKPGQGVGLDVVREAVMHEAATQLAILTPVAGTAASYFVPTLTMKAALATLTLALACLGLFALRSSRSEASVPALPTEMAPLTATLEIPLTPHGELESVAEEPPSPALPPSAAREVVPKPPRAEGIEVHVRDQQGAPIAGVGLYLKKGRMTQLGAERRTDASGNATFPGPFGEEEDTVLELHVDRARKERFVYPNRERVVEWILEDGRNVSGQVVDLNDEGVSGAEIYRVNQKHHDRMHLLTKTDREGRFQVSHLIGEVRFVARASGYQPSEVKRVRRDEINIQLGAKGVRVHGQVRDSEGQAVPHAWVAFGVDEDARENENGSERTPQEGDGDPKLDREAFFVRADENGLFETREVPRGHTMILARSSADDERNLIGWHGQWITSDLASPLVIRLEESGRIVGQLTGPDGQPLEGYPFEAQWEGGAQFGEIEDDLGQLFTNAACLTNEEGRYELSGLFPGEYDIRVVIAEQSKDVRAELDLGLGETATFDAVLEDLNSISIRLVDAQDNPLAGWRVRAGETDQLETLGFLGGWGRSQFDKETGREGGVRFSNLKPGVQRIEFAATENMEGSIPMTIAFRDIEANTEEEETVVRLSSSEMPTASFAGALTATSGAALPEAMMVLVRDGNSPSRARVYTDESGSFTVSGLCAGQWNLHAARNSAGEPGLILSNVVLASGEHKELGTLVDVDRCRIELSLVAGDGGRFGHPDLNLTVNNRRVNWWMEGDVYVTSIQGSSGSGDLVVSAEGYAPKRTPLLWTSHETLTPTITLDPGRLCRVLPLLTEQVTARTKDSASIEITVQDEAGILYRRRATGTFGQLNEVEFRLPPGSYTLRVSDHTVRNASRHKFDLVVEDDLTPLLIDLRSMPQDR